MLGNRVGGPSRTDVITLHADAARHRGARRGLAGERRVLRPDPRIGGAGRGAVPRAVDARRREGRRAVVAPRAPAGPALARRAASGVA